MPIESWYDAREFFKRQIPDVFVKRRFNFITIHYMYMMGMSVLVSVILFGIGGLRYIDSLFFASGACTQSGLNTVDLNLMHTGQQFMLYIAAMFCNPIVVHSAVVFVRLYWFERRFKDVVREARSLRRTKSRSRTTTQQRVDLEDGPQETNVRGKVIRILRNTGKFIESDKHDEKNLPNGNGKSVESSENSKRNSDENVNGDSIPPIGPEVPTDSEGLLKVPLRIGPEQHIRFWEAQRHHDDSEVLRIPSPREFDRGGRPEYIDHSSNEELGRLDTTSPVEQKKRRDSGQSGRPEGQGSHHITINEPDIVRTHNRTSTYPPGNMNKRQGSQSSHLDEPRTLSQTRSKAQTSNTLRRSNSTRTLENVPYLSYQPTIGRNSFFVNLSEEQREELGGIEYRALKTLALVLVVYFCAWHLFGLVCLVPWIMKSKTYGSIVTQQGQGRPWWGIFTAASAFNDLGFTLTNNSMISFGTAIFPMMLMTFLIVIGNTGFPCMLRFSIWFLSKCVPRGSGLWEELRFLLDHPRRCFTLLFPGPATWWLFAVLVVLNGVDLMFFVVLDLKDPVITSMKPFIRFVDGLFQASSTRTAGFGVVNLAELHPAIQVSYLIMMYISVFPIAISMRRTNVYEEKSLGIYASKEEDEEEENASYIGAHLRKQLGFDLWFVFLGLFVIAIVEGDRLSDLNQSSFSLFAVLFEIVSAYGTVGLSLGYPTINASFSAEFHTLSKLIIIAMQIRGRHRGLPYELDRAILLPSESLHEKEAREGQRLMNRRRSSAAYSAVDGQIESDKFRPETGLASGFQREYHHVRDREKESSGRGSLGDHHESRIRYGLGNAMFKLAAVPDAIKEEKQEGKDE